MGGESWPREAQEAQERLAASLGELLRGQRARPQARHLPGVPGHPQSPQGHGSRDSASCRRHVVSVQGPHSDPPSVRQAHPLSTRRGAPAHTPGWGGCRPPEHFSPGRASRLPPVKAGARQEEGLAPPQVPPARKPWKVSAGPGSPQLPAVLSWWLPVQGARPWGDTMRGRAGCVLASRGCTRRPAHPGPPHPTQAVPSLWGTKRTPPPSRSTASLCGPIQPPGSSHLPPH